jgi:hypothetical protein
VQYLIAIRGRFLSLAENKGVSSAVSLGVFSFVVNFDPGAAIAGGRGDLEFEAGGLLRRQGKKLWREMIKGDLGLRKV